MSRFCSVLLAFSLLACEAKDTGDSLGSGASKTAEPAPPVPIKTPDHTEKTDPRNDLDMAIQEMRTSDDSPPRMGTLDRAEMLCKDASAMVAKRAAKNPGVPDDWQSWWGAVADDDVIETRFHGVAAFPNSATGPAWGLVISCVHVAAKKTWQMRTAALIVELQSGQLQLRFSDTLASQGCCSHKLLTPEIIEAVDVNGDGRSELHVRGPYELVGGVEMFFHGDKSYYVFPDAAVRDDSYEALFKVSMDCMDGTSDNLVYSDAGFSMLHSGHLHHFQPLHKYLDTFVKVETRLSLGRKLRAPHAGRELLVRSRFSKPVDDRKLAAYQEAFYSGGQRGAVHDSVKKFKKSASARDVMRWNAEGRWLELECKGKHRLLREGLR